MASHTTTNNKSSADPQIDDKLLELVSEDAHLVDRFGLHITFVILFLVLVLSIAVMRFINVETRRLETVTQAAITQTLSRQMERRLLTLAQLIEDHIETANDARAAMYCPSLHSLFEHNVEFLELTFVDENRRVLQTCLTPSSLDTHPHRIGEALDQPKVIEAFETAMLHQTHAYSVPYTSSASRVPVPMVDLIIPNADETAFLARFSLSTLIRQLTDNSFDFKYHAEILVDGEPFPARDSALPAADNISAKASLAPLPDNVTIETRNTGPYPIYTHTTLVRGIFFFGAMLVLAIFGVLRFQYRQARTESELRARVIVQQALSQSFLDGICVTDRTGRILFTNGALDKMLGCPTGSLLGLVPPYRFVRKADTFPFDVLIASEAVKNGMHIEFQAVRTDGEIVDCAVEIVKLHTNTAEPGQSGWLLVIREITEQNRAHQAMTMAHERTLRVLESMDATVSVVSRQKTSSPELLFANKRYVDAFGNSPEAHLRLRALLMQIDPISRGAEVWDSITQRWYFVGLSEVAWIDGIPVETLTIRDVTERRNAKTMLEHQIRNAEQSSRLITMGEMASSLAHELNQPLAAVANYASATLMRLQSNKLTYDDACAGLTKIINQTHRAAQIIKRIRGFAKRNDPLMGESEVGRILEETMELASMQSKKLRVPIELDVQSTTKTITCDAVLIEQVLINLLKNAMEASVANAGARVKLSVVDEGANIVFYVIDNGSGISPEVAAHLFDPFFTTKETGIGIGLNICRSIIESHHGRLTFENNPEGGTTFKVSLPIVPMGLQCA